MTKEKVFKIIKQHWIKAVIGCLCIVTPIFGLAVINKPSVSLDIFDGTLVWKYNRFLGDNKYTVYRNGEVILASKQTKLKDIDSADKTAPEDIKSVDVSYNESDIVLTWLEPLDKGSINDYIVNVENDANEILASSESVKMEVVSGVSEYIVDFNGDKYDVSLPEFKIDGKTVKDGVYDVKIVAVDKSGNRTNPYIKTLEIYRPYIEGVNIKIKSNRDFNYKAFIGDEPIDVEGNKINIKSLRDNTGPKKIEKISVWNRGEKASAVWMPVGDMGTEYEVSVVGNTEDGDKVFGTDIVMGKAIGVKGYYYAVSESSTYSITGEDKFVGVPLITSFQVPYKKTYLHVAPVDDNGNIGQVTTKAITREE